MKESDYITATNLAKLRLAEYALRSVLPQGDVEGRLFTDASLAVTALRQRYEKKVEQ